MRKIPMILLAIMLALSACQGGGDSGDSKTDEGTAAVDCTPDETPLTIEAKNNDFDAECLAAKADEQFTIAITNNDPEPHNISILEEKGGEALFRGEPMVQPNSNHTYTVNALPAGRYYFQCDVHPEMNGLFIVAG